MTLFASASYASKMGLTRRGWVSPPCSLDNDDDDDDADDGDDDGGTTMTSQHRRRHAVPIAESASSSSSTSETLSPRSLPQQSRRHSDGGEGGAAHVQHVLLQEWYPCTHGRSLIDYMSREENGPFLRTLRNTWCRLNSPDLESVRELGSSMYAAGAEDGLAASPSDLHALSIHQERAIAHSIYTAMHSTQPFTTLKPFDTFAAQLGLFSAIKAELQAIEQGVTSADDRLRLYHEAWRKHLAAFDLARTANCSQPRAHLCLGDLIWGEAYQWPLQALQFSYLGYSLPLGAASPTPIQPPPPPAPPVPAISAPTSAVTWQYGYQSTTSPPAVASSSSHSSSFGTPRSSRMNSTPATTALTSNSPSMSADDEVKAATDANATWSAVFTPEHIDTAAPPRQQSIFSLESLFARRPTLTEFWDHGISSFFHTAAEGSAAVAAVAGNDDETVLAVDDWQGAAAAATAAAESSTSTSKRQAPPTHITFNVNDSMQHLGLSSPLSEQSSNSASAPLYYNALSDFPFLSSPSSSTAGAGTSTHTLSPGSTSSRSNKPSPYGTRPPYRARSSTMDSQGSQGKGKGKGKATSSSSSSSDRSQRHYVRLMTQRTLLKEVIARMQQAVNGLLRTIGGQSHLIDAMVAALAGEGGNGAQSSASDGVDAGGPMNSNRRKRESKKRLRDVDMQNMLILGQLANILQSVPLNRIIACVATMADAAAAAAQAPDDRVIQAMLQVWLDFRHGWGDLAMAEKRFAPRNEQGAVTVMLQLLRIATGSDLQSPAIVHDDGGGGEVQAKVRLVHTNDAFVRTGY